jgi:hypothetical protein
MEHREKKTWNYYHRSLHIHQHHMLVGQLTYEFQLLVEQLKRSFQYKLSTESD